MTKILRFTILKGIVSIGNKKRKQLTSNEHGCNEPFKDRYWCPRKKWFMKEPCIFYSEHECRMLDAFCKCKSGY